MSIVVTVESAPSREIAASWAALVQRAAGNVFADPAALRAAEATSFSRPRTLLAWAERDGAPTLVGAWSFSTRRLLPCCAILTAPAYKYAFAGTPVLDPHASDAATAALLDAIVADRTLPKVLRLKDVDADSSGFAALMRLVDERGWRTLRLSTSQRPIATAESGVKRSGATRKKLRQDWGRLSALGVLEMTNSRDHADAVQAFETFLALEAHSWKGERGTALLNRAGDAAFARRLIADLAAERNASVALLLLANRPIAAQVVLYSGRVAFTWKTAFDADFAKFSPGMLLVDRLSDHLLADGDVEKIDSCSPEKSFMAQLWTGRQTMVDLLVDLNPRASATFRVACLGEAARRWIKSARDRWRAQGWPSAMRRRPEPATG